MRYLPLPCLFVVLSSMVLSHRAAAQGGPPGPAPELQRLAPLAGNWTGSGVMHEPGGATTKWTADGSCAWCLEGHFLQAVFAVRFDGVDGTFHFRDYYGWDRERHRYVVARVDSGGQARLHDLQRLADGALVRLSLTTQGEATFAEREVVKVDGDEMTLATHLLIAAAAPVHLIDGRFARGGPGCAADRDGEPWQGAVPHEQIARLCRSAGVYDVSGEMVMAAAQPPIGIRGTDTFSARYSGLVLHGRTEGEVQGLPGEYVGDVFWAYDQARGCLGGFYVSNAGEAMALEARWAPDGRLVATGSGLLMGQPMVRRTMLEFAPDGAARAAQSHAILGTAPPIENFRATYTKRK